MEVLKINLEQRKFGELSTKLVNRRCYTLGDMLNGKQDPEGGQKASSLKSLQTSPLLERIKADAIFNKAEHTVGQEDTAAINELASVIIEAPAPLAIGRDLIHLYETQREILKIRKPKLGKAFKSGRGKTTNSVGRRDQYVTVTVDQFIEDSDEWDLPYIEDSPWNVLAEQTQEVARSVKQLETEGIIADLEAISSGNLATGGEISAVTSGLFTWEDLCNLWGGVASQDFSPDRTAMNPLQAADLFKEQEFTNQLMLGDYVDLSVGRFGRTILGTDILVSSLISTGHVYMLSSVAALAYVLRRDMMVRTWDNTKEEIYGVGCNIRYGLKDLYNTAVARGTDF